jgi:ferritin
MKQAVLDGINEQIKNELYSGYLYLGMSSHFEMQNLKGFAHWMRLQAQEELEHAIRLFDHVARRGGRVTLLPIEAPPTEYGTPLSIFQKALEHERHVSRSINDLYRLARQESEYATELELQWFVQEQVMEEDNAATAVDQLELAGDNKAAMLMLDRQFGQRTGTDTGQESA